MVGGTAYAATFWARASTSRSLPVTATLPTGGALASQSVTIGTTWQQYQVILTPATSGHAVLEFFLGTQAGDVWFDDVHFQQGVTNAWRRDFQNGIVLVNPSVFPMQVPLGGTFRRILGTVDPVTNDGTATTTALVPAADALFMIGTAARDTIPPATIKDARLGP